MPRAFFTNTAPVDIGGKKPGQVFQIEVDRDGHPVETYWRKRLAEGAIAPRVKARPDSVASAAPAMPATSASASPPSPTKATKKGA